MIDVIIPVYNTSKYLSRCMNSLLNQTYTQFNVILVNDGSTDNSGELCDKYASEHENISAYHKENGGLSSARNYGIEKSTAEYITFVDPDDYVNKHWLEVLWKAMDKYDADMVSAGVTMVYDTSDVGADDDTYGLAYSELIEKDEAYRRMFAQLDIDVSMCTKLFKRKIFDEIRFPIGELYEDMQVIGQVVEACERIVAMDNKGYFYYQRAESIMYGSMSEKRMKLVSCMESLHEQMDKRYPKAEEAARTRCVRCYIHVFNRTIFDDAFKAQEEELRKKIVQEKKFVRKGQYFGRHEKVAVEMIALNVGLYKLFLKIYRRNK